MDSTYTVWFKIILDFDFGPCDVHCDLLPYCMSTYCVLSTIEDSSPSKSHCCLILFMVHFFYVKSYIREVGNFWLQVSCFVYNECSIYPLFITRIIRIMNYWLKILSLDDYSPVKRIYNISLEL